MGRAEREKQGYQNGHGTTIFKSISLSKTNKSKYFQVSVNLNKIVELNEVKKTVTLEPGVIMEQISRYLFKRGWTIPVVPELETLSIGGLICGVGIETSSHKLGLFHDTALSYEVVLPSGKLVTCSKEKDPDLFFSIPGSFGTVGFLTGVTFPITPCKQYVKVQYHVVRNMAGFQALLRKERDHNFVEGFMYSKNSIVVMLGDMDNGEETERDQTNQISRWHKPPFAKHVENILTSKLCYLSPPSFVEWIPLIDYYHRCSLGAFWLIEKIFPAINWFSFLFLFGWQLPANTHVQALIPQFVMRYILKQGQIIQDYIVPMERAKEFLEVGDRLLKFYPIWLCPARMMSTSTMFPCLGDGDYVDIGYYSDFKGRGDRKKVLQELKQLFIDVKGFQLLYADCLMTRQQIHEMYDTGLYDKVRQEQGCEAAFPDIYDKTGPKAKQLE